MADLKQMTNTATVRGTLKTNNLELSVDNTQQSIIRGNLTVEFQDQLGNINNVRAEVYVREFKLDGNENKMFASYKTIMNEYKDIDSHGQEEADEIIITGELNSNEYIDRSGVLINTSRLRAVFVNRFDETKKQHTSTPVGATVVMGAIVDSLSDEYDAEGLPTGRKKVEIYTVGYNNNVSKFDKVFIPEQLAEQSEGFFYKGFNGLITLAIKHYAEVSEVKTEAETLGFGVGASDPARVITNYKDELWLVGADMFRNESDTLDENNIEQVKKLYKEKLATVESRNSTSAPQPTSGFGTQTTKTTTIPGAENPLQSALNSDVPVF